MKISHANCQFTALAMILGSTGNMLKTFMFDFPSAYKIADAMDAYGEMPEQVDAVTAGFISDVVMGNDRVGAVQVLQGDTYIGMILVRVSPDGDTHDALAITA